MNDNTNLSSLIEVLTWMREKYGDITFPLHCEHDVLTLCGYDVDTLTDSDVQFLADREFIVDWDLRAIQSFHFGAA